jgi:hypothetical protein
MERKIPDSRPIFATLFADVPGCRQPCHDKRGVLVPQCHAQFDGGPFSYHGASAKIGAPIHCPDRPSHGAVGFAHRLGAMWSRLGHSRHPAASLPRRSTVIPCCVNAACHVAREHGQGGCPDIIDWHLGGKDGDMLFHETTRFRLSILWLRFVVLTGFLMLAGGRDAALARGASRSSATGAARLHWHRDYAKAYALAKRERRMLLVNFVPPADGDQRVQQELDRWVESDERLRSRIEELVLVRLPDDAQIDDAGKPIRLLAHPAFEPLSGPGIAMLDLRDPRQPCYGRVVTVLPFNDGKYYRWRNGHLNVALELPAGTLSQRTMVWAVRVHHEAPASTQGEQHPALAQAAADQAGYQADLGVQGHHRWETRSGQICAAAGASGASEVVAESWPNENLLDAAIDCVASWRQSPGHWQAVRKRQRLFGYDIRRGRNGIWYGTGIFAN